MKKILLFIFGLGLMVQQSNAQTKTTYYPGTQQKMSEGVLLGADATVLSPSFESLPKDQQELKLRSTARDGVWTYWYPNGQVQRTEQYSNGMMVGIWTGYFENGVVSHVLNFTTGDAVYYFSNGKKQSEGKIANNMVQEGHWTGWYQHGLKNFEGNYVNGIKDGLWIFYDIKGRKTDEQVFQGGNLVTHNKF